MKTLVGSTVVSSVHDVVFACRNGMLVARLVTSRQMRVRRTSILTRALLRFPDVTYGAAS